MHRWVNRLMCQTHRKIFCRCFLLLVVVNEVNTTVNHTGACCSGDWVAAHGNIWDLGVSPVAVSEPSSGPLCVSLATRDATCPLRWTSHSIQGQGNQICISFLLHGTSIESEASLLLCFTSLLTAWERTRSHREGCCRGPSQPPISYRFPGVSVAMGMFSFKLWQASTLSRHPGALAATIHAAFPPRRNARGACIGDSRRWGWRYKQEDHGWFWAFQLGSKSESTWPLPLAAKSHQLPQNDSFVSP